MSGSAERGSAAIPLSRAAGAAPSAADVAAPQERYLRWQQAVAAAATVPVGLTPRELVWSRDRVRLYRYHGAAPPTYPVPLLLVYALVNKPYIFDLLPGRSFVEFMLGEGFDVYLLDWGSPGLEDRCLGLDDYALDYLPRALEEVRRRAGGERVSVLGYCIGGTLVTLYAGAVPTAPIRNLILLSAPLDFTDRRASLFARWFDERYVDVDRLVETLGNVPAELIEVWAQMLRPVENYIGVYLNLWERLDDPAAVESWQAMHRWVHDGVPFAGTAFRQWVVDHVRGNRLVQGTCTLRGRPVRLEQIRMPVLLVVAEQDHIVPMRQTTGIVDRLGSRDRRVEVMPGGHVGLMSGRQARREVWPKIAAWLRARSGRPRRLAGRGEGRCRWGERSPVGAR